MVFLFTLLLTEIVFYNAVTILSLERYSSYNSIGSSEIQLVEECLH